MNARRATWILFGVVLVICFGLAEVMLRVGIPRTTLLAPGEDAYWFMALSHNPTISDAGKDVQHHEKLGWRMRRSFEGKSHTTNSVGMRGRREYPVERVPDMKRVALIGDSYTFGLGVGDDDTFHSILEASRDDLEVLNFGTNGWGTDQSFIDFMDYRRPYDPDVIVVGIYEDDYNRNGVRAREYLKPRFVVEDGALKLTNVPIPSPTQLDRSTLPNFDRLRLIDAGYYVYRNVRWKTVGKYQRDGPFEEKAEILRLLLKNIQTYANEGPRKRHVVVMTWPTMFFEKGWDSKRIRARVMDISGELGIPAYDITQALLERQAKDGVPIYGDVSSHWTRAGHEVAAEQLRAHFEKIGF